LRRLEAALPASVEFLGRAAAETGFQVEALEKVIRLGELAADVARHPLLGPALALKGGTALNLCWGSPSRLSVDLDYNVIEPPEREAMLEARPRIEAALDELGRRRAHLVQRSADTFAGRKIFLGFTSAFGAPGRIEVDLNFVFRKPVGATELRPLWQPGGLDSPSTHVVSLTELCIGKILALLDRGAPRDAWDVARLPDLPGASLASPRIRAQFLALSATLDHPVTRYTRDRLAMRLGERTIREQLLPMLTVGEAPSALELVERAWAVVEPLLELTEREVEFVEAISHGEFLPELLGHRAAADLRDHPAIEWKLRNVREHLRRTAAVRAPASRRKREA